MSWWNWSKRPESNESEEPPEEKGRLEQRVREMKLAGLAQEGAEANIRIVLNESWIRAEELFVLEAYFFEKNRHVQWKPELPLVPGKDTGLQDMDEWKKIDQAYVDPWVWNDEQKKHVHAPCGALELRTNDWQDLIVFIAAFNRKIQEISLARPDLVPNALKRPNACLDLKGQTDRLRMENICTVIRTLELK